MPHGSDDRHLADDRHFADDRHSREEGLLERLRAAQEAHYRSATEHKNAIEAARRGLVEASLDGSQFLHSMAVAEYQALETYSKVVQEFAEAVLYAAKPSADPESTPELTPREREVLKLIAEGLSSKKIADCLNISFRTVVSHRFHIMEKLRIHDVVSLTKYAIRCGIVRP